MTAGLQLYDGFMIINSLPAQDNIIEKRPFSGPFYLSGGFSRFRQEYRFPAIFHHIHYCQKQQPDRDKYNGNLHLFGKAHDH